MLQGKRDADTVLAMGIMEDVSSIPQPAGGELMHSSIIANVYIFTLCLSAVL